MTSKKLIFLASTALGLLATGLFAFVLNAPTANSISGSQWQAGHITDDGVFFNPDLMTAQEIQNFFDAKVPVCDTNGTQQYSLGTSRATYGTSRGYPPPYICLKDYSQSIPSKSPDAYCSGSINEGTKSAAQIVWDVAQACDINPKVLIVLLQKEQSLVTDDWPWSIQYRSATGYGCPDTAPCDAEYYGFFNQVYMAARQFQRYAKLPHLYNFAGGRTSFVQYNPNAGCGGTNVYMVNQSTAGLYNYTPYQPNQAALNNLYGTGDGCSAYGNRNYWRLFHDWFGTTYAPDYSWSLIGQYAYTDNTKTTPIDLANLLAGERVFIGFQAKNMGNQTWTNSGANPVRAGASNPFDRNSSFCDSTWLTCNRPAVMNEASVAPGETATFEFWYQAAQTGSFSEHFTPLVEGVQWMNNIGMNFYTIVRPPTYTWSIVSQYAFTDQTKSTWADSSNLVAGQRVYAGFKARNTGNMTWTNSGANPVRAGASNPFDRNSSFCDSTWLSCNRPASMLESSVAPGGIATFEFWYKAPPQSGSFHEYFRPVLEGVQWMNNTGMNFYTSVVPPVYSWSIAGQFAFTNSAKTTPVDLTNLSPGQRVFIGFHVRNTGNVSWPQSGANPVRAGTVNPRDRSSPFCDATWLTCNRPAIVNENNLAPGQVGTVEFWYQAPSTSGTYFERFSMLAEGLQWMNDPGMGFYTVVN